MSLTIETYTQNDIYAEYLWDKYSPHFEVFVGKKHCDGIVYTLWSNRYNTEEQARKSFKRQVRKIKKGELK